MQSIKDKYYTVAEFAKYIGKSTKTVYLWIKEKKINFEKVGGGYYIDKDNYQKVNSDE